MSSHRSDWVWLGLVATSCGIGSSSAQAQFPISSGPPIIMNAPVAAPVGPVTTSVSPSTGSSRVTYALPFLSDARRKARTANRYTVARPVYSGRPGVTFAPYSDYYFPRVIGSKETVYTASREAPAPVGYRAFARPGTPVFPR